MKNNAQQNLNLPMEEMDTREEFESPHYIDYDDMLEHVIQGDHQLLYLDTYLREAFAQDNSN